MPAAVGTFSGAEIGQKFRYRAVEYGMLQFWGDFRKGLQDESAPGQLRMRQGEVGVGEDQAGAAFGLVEQQVEIDKTGPLGGLVSGAYPSHGGFHGEE